MGGPSQPSAPKPPKAPTQTRKAAQLELDSQLRQGNTSGNPLFSGNSGSVLGAFIGGDPQARLDNRPDSDFLPALETRDFQLLDAQVRGGSSGDSQVRQPRNQEMVQSLLDLLGEGIDSPTIL